PGDRDVGHGGEVVDLGRARGAQRVDERALVEQVALMEGDPVAKVLDAVELLRGGATHHAVHLIALVEQQFGQIGAILACYPGDECGATVGHRRQPIETPPARWALVPSAVSTRAVLFMTCRTRAPRRTSRCRAATARWPRCPPRRRSGPPSRAVREPSPRRASGAGR